MKGDHSCPDCWGTGFVRGWGAPCTRGGEPSPKPEAEPEDIYRSIRDWLRKNQGWGVAQGDGNPGDLIEVLIQSG